MQTDDDNAFSHCTAMRNFFFHRMIWLMLTAVPLNATAACLPHVIFPVQSPYLETLSLQEQQEARGLLFKVSPSVAQQLSLDDKRQHKRLLTLMRYAAAPVRGQIDAAHIRLTAVPCFSWICLFFPRKLAPRSATDDPFPT
jgi:hypothetical protein